MSFGSHSYARNIKSKRLEGRVGELLSNKNFNWGRCGTEGPLPDHSAGTLIRRINPRKQI